jgi:hypothetical protein
VVTYTTNHQKRQDKAAKDKKKKKKYSRMQYYENDGNQLTSGLLRVSMLHPKLKNSFPSKTCTQRKKNKETKKLTT